MAVNLGFPMQLRRLGCPLFWGLPLCVLALLSGCEGRDPASNPSVAQTHSDPPKLSSAEKDGAHPQLSAAQRVKRTDQLTAELAAMEAEKVQLLQRRADVYARLTQHQEQGSAMLAKLRAQMDDVGRHGVDEALKLEARSKVEAALAQDDELTESLNELDAQIAQIDQRMAELTVQLDKVGQQQIAETDR